MDRIPSFLPAPNLVSDVSKKRCRELRSPTGKTPLQECKRQPACPIGNTRTAWSVKEKEFFENYLKEVEVTGGGANSFWNNFAILLNKHCGAARTGQLSRSRYTRVRSLFGETKSETVSHQSGTHADRTSHTLVAEKVLHLYSSSL